jgi:putative peptidoglycan lipid II flippase
VFIFAPQLTHLITSSGFSAAQVELASQLTRIILVAQFFFAVSNFLSGTIQAQQRFLIPALSPSAYNLGIILGVLILSPWIGIYGAAVGVVFGALLHLLLQLPLAIKLGYRYTAVIDWHHKGVKEMIKLTPPRIFALGVDQIELLISVFFATALPTGSLTVINLAQQMMTAPTRIFSVPLGQASLPFLSKQVSDGDEKLFSKTLHESLQHIFFLAFPAGMLLLILRIPLVRIAYGASDFPWAATLLTGKAVAILSIALFAQGGSHLLVRANYALHNTMTPLIVSIISVTINLLLSYLGVFVWQTGVLGLALAVTIAEIVHFMILFTILLYKLEDWNFKQVMLPTLKIVIASSVMGIALWIPMRLLDTYVFDTTRVIPLLFLTGTASIIGGGMYLFLAKILHIHEYQAYMSIIYKIGNWKQVLRQSEEVLEPASSSSELTS